MQILVTGATGNVGSQVARQLVLQDIPVVAAVRDTRKASSAVAVPAFRTFDFNDPATWSDALAGVTGLYLVLPPGTTDSSIAARLLDQAQAAGIRHIVLNSGRTTGDLPGEPLYETEQLIRTSGMQWTILRPGWFMQNFTNWTGFTIPKEDAFYLPAGNASIAFVDVRDIGAVAASVFSAPDEHHGKVYELTCSEAIDHYEVARHISEAAGREIRYVPMEAEAYIRFLVDNGWPKAAAAHTDWLFSFTRQGKEEKVSPDVQNILGKEPINFARFAEDYKEAWSKK